MRLLYRERHKACVAGFFDSLCDEALVQRARAGQTAGQNFALVRYELHENIDPLVFDCHVFHFAEAAGLLFEAWAAAATATIITVVWPPAWFSVLTFFHNFLFTVLHLERDIVVAHRTCIKVRCAAHGF
jgi:hypothetical protein